MRSPAAMACRGRGTAPQVVAGGTLTCTHPFRAMKRNEGEEQGLLSFVGEGGSRQNRGSPPRQAAGSSKLDGGGSSEGRGAVAEERLPNLKGFKCYRILFV